MIDKLRKIIPGIYSYGEFQIMKVDKNCWRITNEGYGNDFVYLKDAVYFCKIGGSLYPPAMHLSGKKYIAEFGHDDPWNGDSFD